MLPDEVTIGEALNARGYHKVMVGKWHLVDRSPSLPNDKEFDYFLGSHYSIDMILAGSKGFNYKSGDKY